MRGSRGAAVAVLVAVTACGGGGSAGGPSESGKQPAAVVTASPGPDGVQTVQVVGTAQLTFRPSTVVASPGTIRFVFHSATDVPHTLDFPAFGKGTGTTQGTKPLSVTITVDKPGTYDYECAFHPGMTGKLIVRAEG